MKLKSLFITLIATTLLASCANEEMRRQEAIDENITRSIQDAFLVDSTLKAYPIDVDTMNSEVHLTGNVDTHEEAARATKKALTVKGVKSVQNKILIRKSVNEPMASSSYVKRASKDANITSSVKTALLRSKGIHATGISVKTRNGVVYLSGTVPTNADRSKAIELARGLTGVEGVESAIEVQ